MSVSKRSAITELGGTLISDHAANATAETNVTGATSGSIYMIDVDNTANAAVMYFKINDHASSGGAGVTPQWMFMAEGGKKTSFIFDAALAYSAGVTTWCTAGAAVGNSVNPPNSVIVNMIVS